ncbi:cyclic nucleotide-binding domain-containing protein [Pseudaestuariivita atlantica]|uniref:Cyclic nucleotide-binding domain-containing protein n=1 Tax=Pseudaestuariivita atlantica TaxID=1317121 RepID=A0A0L1JTB8_9RHOB|nr:cyclic nucleotide-binding domain-containing protein [Pseudaestuariivita atlantica]KNG94990.1 hypothetical protein ATO11_06420 [Pseudaestuariivita atlantica]
MWDWIVETELLVYLAGLSFVLGYVIINQVVLRLWVTVGTVLYILYYATAADQPLWGAIYMSLAMGAANLFGLFSLLWQRSKYAVPRAHQDLYRTHFSHVPPGDFRAIMARGKRYVTDTQEAIATLGVPAPRVVFLVSGHAVVDKEGERFNMPEGWFFGEVSYVLDQPAAASATVPEGTELVSWDRADLDALRQKPRLRLAFEAAVSRDVARKVSVAVAPRRLRVAPGPAPEPAA